MFPIRTKIQQGYRCGEIPPGHPGGTTAYRQRIITAHRHRGHIAETLTATSSTTHPSAADDSATAQVTTEPESPT